MAGGAYQIRYFILKLSSPDAQSKNAVSGLTVHPQYNVVKNSIKLDRIQKEKSAVIVC